MINYSKESQPSWHTIWNDQQYAQVSGQIGSISKIE